MTAYYNEIDEYAAEWLRNLIDAGHIAPGVVDTRSIEDVLPSDLRGFTQCHFFAGIGVWSYALRRAGWPDDRPVWSGSCPCQPFSAAGKGAGFDDERHLWPHWHHLIGERRPPVVFGEQVASKDAAPWIDLVQDDMEAMGYAFGAIPFPAAGVGAPHIRDRLYWVADSDQERRHQRDAGSAAARRAGGGIDPAGRIRARELADDSGIGRQRRPHASRPAAQDAGQRGEGLRHSEPCSMPRELADSSSTRLEGRVAVRQRADECAAGPGGVAGALADDDDAGRRGEPRLRLRGSAFHDADGRGPLGGFWADAEWIACRDGKWRPVEPGTFPLAHGAPARVGRLRAYGNAINAEAARVFIESYLGAIAERIAA